MRWAHCWWLLSSPNLGLWVTALRLYLRRYRCRYIHWCSWRCLIFLRDYALVYWLLCCGLDSPRNFSDLSYVTKASFLVFLVYWLLSFGDWQSIWRVLMLCFWNWSMCFLIIASIRVLIVQIQSILLHSLMSGLYHYCLNLVRVTHVRHLLCVQRFLLAQLARLYCDSLLAPMNWCSTSSVLVVSWAYILYSSCSFRTLLLCKRHVLWLHHIRRHTECLLVTSMADSRSSNGLDLCLLHSHHIQGLFGCNCIQNIMISSLLSTEIGIIIIQSV